MDSKSVNRWIRAEVQPVLREAGFSAFSPRSAWRYGNNERVDVVNFQSFNSYNAGVLGCTTYSFSVNLGCYFCEVPRRHSAEVIKSVKGQMRPEECQCHFRGRLCRSSPQPKHLAPDIWYIDPEGQLLERAIHDVRVALVRDALPWFAKLATPGEPLRVLVEEDEHMQKLWGFGRNPSPSRHYLTGYFAALAGETALARTHLRKAIHSGCFESVAERMELDLGRLA